MEQLIAKQRFAAYMISQGGGQFLVHGYKTRAAASQPPIGELVARTQTLEGARAVLPEGWHVVEGVFENIELWAP
jgi:hypothetical protein